MNKYSKTEDANSLQEFGIQNDDLAVIKGGDGLGSSPGCTLVNDKTHYVCDNAGSDAPDVPPVG